MKLGLPLRMCIHMQFAFFLLYTLNQKISKPRSYNILLFGRLVKTGALFQQVCHKAIVPQTKTKMQDRRHLQHNKTSIEKWSNTWINILIMRLILGSKSSLPDYIWSRPIL